MGNDPPVKPPDGNEPENKSESGLHQDVDTARDAYTAGRDLYVTLDRQSKAVTTGPLGRVIGELGEQDALALEVHQAFTAGAASTAIGSGQVPVLPLYLPRPAFDDRLRTAVAGAAQSSRMVVVVGDSSTGKTRACWEAIRTELPDWRIWHPLTPERPAALAEAVRVGRINPRTVIWLNEAQFYLQPAGGEQVAAEVQALLADPARGPILVLGSMWPGFRAALTHVPEDPSAPDPHRAARVLLGRAEYVTAPIRFTTAQLTDLATTIATDPRLSAAAAQSRGGRITQELAGAPELLHRYQQATPAARAVLWAAMDARRLGHSPHLPEPFLKGAAPGYLDDHQWDQTGGADWFSAALSELTAPHRCLSGPLVEHQPRPGEAHPAHRLYRLADYLEQHARAERALLCPPTSFWDAAADHAHTPDDRTALGEQAGNRGRYRHAAHLYRRAADAGHPDVLLELARLREEAGNQEDANQLYRQADNAGTPDALLEFALQGETIGDQRDAEQFYWQAPYAEHPYAFGGQALLREEAGDREGAERLHSYGLTAAGETEVPWT